MTYPRPMVTATVALFDPQGRILIGRRSKSSNAFPGFWCLPGGFLNVDSETTLECAKRELLEETGLKDVTLHLLHVSSGPKTDPRGHIVNVVYWGQCSAEAGRLVAAGDDIEQLWWLWPEGALQEKIAFDHAVLIVRAESKWKGVQKWDI